jgi:hypothetical protein
MKNQSFLQKIFAYFLFLALSAITKGQTQTTPLQTRAFNSAANGTSGVVNDGPLSAGASETLDQFEKFNPALGTLVEVLLTVEVNANYSIQVTADSLIDSNALFSISIPSDGDNYIQAGLIYGPSNSVFGYAVTFDNASFPGLEFLDENPQDHGAPGNFQFSGSIEDIFGGFSGEGETPTSGSIPVTAEYFNPSDFIGTGNVVGLSFDLLTQISTSGTIDNLLTAGLQHSISFAAGNVTLQYVYLPSNSGPPPTITSYAKDGTNHTINFTGAPGVSGWLVKGSINLASFPNDHTSAAVFTESPAGVYQCTFALPSLATELKYFFRIERN